MEHVTHIELENFLSFRKAACRLSPFTLVVGANNSGKSNLMEAIVDLHVYWHDSTELIARRHHAAGEEDAVRIAVKRSDGKQAAAYFERGSASSPKRAILVEGVDRWTPPLVAFHRLDPQQIGAAEEDGDGSLRITREGKGVTRLLESLSSGTRAHRTVFHRIERELCRCVPEIEAISLFTPERGKRAVQVEQRGLSLPSPLSELSEGTRLVVAILTIVNREPGPKFLVFEDIDRAVHPWLFEKLVDFLRGLTRSGRVQIIATCHNPYLVDEFKDEPEAVVIVEKKDGASVLSNMDDRIAALRQNGEMEMPLGEVWFRGFAGGVPQPKLPDLLRVAETP